MPLIIIVAADGSVSVCRKEPQREAPARRSLLPKILEQLQGATFSAAAILPLISQEIALVIVEMARCERDESLAPKRKSFANQVSALLALQKQVKQTDALTHRDVLNFDGPKFRYVLGRLLDLFTESLEQGLGPRSEPMVQSIMRHFRDLIAMVEADLRRETAKIDSGNTPH